MNLERQGRDLLRDNHQRPKRKTEENGLAEGPLEETFILFLCMVVVHLEGSSITCKKKKPEKQKMELKNSLPNHFR